MTTARNHQIKSLPATPNSPQAAHPAAALMTDGEPKGVGRKAVPVAVLTGPRPQPVRWLDVIAPPSFSALVSARSWCRCGYERTARGRSGVLTLIEAHSAHPEHCPLLNLEGSKAA
ncbi:hypothetical protein ACIQM0_25525 [Streptomyces sp. NPDC091387]|uniref:hypothetical protein n=1 Tax=Streptomyces sp. NPDC091387 TaxID=3365998 RepID=UPI00380F2243